MGISTVRKSTVRSAGTLARLLVLAATVLLVTVLTRNIVAADTALIESGDEGDYKYELYSDGELKIKDLVIYGNTVYRVHLSSLSESVLYRTETVTVDMTGVKDGSYIYIGSYIVYGNAERVCNATKLTFLNAPDNYSYDILNLPELRGENIVFPEGVKIDALWLENMKSIDSFEFLSKYSINWLDIGNSGDLKKIDLTSCNAGRISVRLCSGLEKVIFPRKASMIEVSDCGSLTELSLPAYCEYASVTGCGKLKCVYVNAGLKSAYYKCFERCNALKDIYYSGSSLSFDAITLFKWDFYNNPVDESGLFKDITGKYTIHYSGQGWNKTGENDWVYLDQNGEALTGWQSIGGSWYYFDAAGIMITGWLEDGDTWYYLKETGAMAKGWQKINGCWYYFEPSGAMVTGWQEIGGLYYYFKPNGAMAANEFCDGYWLSANGAWTYKHRASWKKDSTGWWYGDDTGWYAKNESLTIDGKKYEFDSAGYLKE